MTSFPDTNFLTPIFWWARCCRVYRLCCYTETALSSLALELFPTEFEGGDRWHILARASMYIFHISDRWSDLQFRFLQRSIIRYWSSRVWVTILIVVSVLDFMNWTHNVIKVSMLFSHRLQMLRSIMSCNNACSHPCHRCSLFVALLIIITHIFCKAYELSLTCDNKISLLTC